MSDSDEYELYPNAGKRYIKNRDELRAKAEKMIAAIDLLSDTEVKNFLENEDFTTRPLSGQSNSSNNCNKDIISGVDAINSEYISEDDIPLAERARSLRRGKLRKRNLSPSSSKQKRRKKNSRGQNNKQPSASPVRNLGVIVLDDDTGYPINTLPPIDFNSRYHKENRQSEILENISLDSVINLDSESDDIIENYNAVTITIEWNNNKNTTRKEFELRRYQKFESIFDELAKMENITTNRVQLTYDLKSVNPMDTPSSLNLKFYGAFKGSISATEINWNRVNLDNENDNIDTSKPKKSGIQVKLLLQSKQTLLFTILKHQKMDVLYSKCAEELNCVKSKLKLVFDGEPVEPMELVSDLGIEDGDVFDVHVKV